VFWGDNPFINKILENAHTESRGPWSSVIGKFLQCSCSSIITFEGKCFSYART
jgi:hypothetical protein